MRIEEHLRQSARRLFTSPGSLLLSLLLLSAFFRPYAGLYHDARLYAVQVVNHTMPEVHAEDLYLKYGSQDSYSVFSLLVAPLVEVAGVPLAFFLLYLGGNACWLFAVQRFVPRLRGRSIAALGAVVYVAVNPLPFGGLGTFHVNENFLTPRVWSVAFVVLGLGGLLRGRQASAFGWIALAMLLHPIMGFSGLCIWILYQLLRSVRPMMFLVLTLFGSAAIAGMLLYEPLGTAIFGRMDDVWRGHVVARSSYCVPSVWLFEDWLAVVTAFAIVASGRMFVRLTTNSKRLLDAVMLLAAVSLATSFVAPILPYKLLLQGQAYRALWPLQFIQIPVLFALVGCLIRGCLSRFGNWAAVVVWFSFASVEMAGRQIVLAALALAAVSCWWKANRNADHDAVNALRAGAIGSVIGLGIVVLPIGLTLPHLLTFGWCGVALIPKVVGPFLTWAVAIGLLFLLRGQLRNAAVYRGVAMCGWLGMQTSFFLLPQSSLGDPFRVEAAEEVAFVGNYLDHRRPAIVRTPVLYWPTGPLGGIWIRLGCDSYYSIPQTAGIMFNRGTAIEGHRRARLTREFELDVRREWLQSAPENARREAYLIFGAICGTEPTERELLRLCREEEIDLIIVPNRFDGWYSATDGRLFIYDARQIRESLASTASARMGGAPSGGSGTAVSLRCSTQ